MRFFLKTHRIKKMLEILLKNTRAAEYSWQTGIDDLPFTTSSRLLQNRKQETLLMCKPSDLLTFTQYYQDKH